MRPSRLLLSSLTAAAMMTSAIASSAQSTDLTNLTPAEADAFGAQVRAYLLENPQVLTEAISVLQEREAAQAARADSELLLSNADALYDSPADLVLGNPDGDITMVEFMDYRCPYCKQAHQDVQALLENDGNIRLIIKELPVLGEASVLASRFALATKLVAGDEAYAFVHEVLMSQNNEITQGSLRRLVRGMDFDADDVFEMMDSDVISDIISANYALAQNMNVSGTPAFTIGDQVLRGYIPYEGMVQLVAEHRS